jgi:hypothetical protein
MSHPMPAPGPTLEQRIRTAAAENRTARLLAPTLEQKILSGDLDLAYAEAIDLSCSLAFLQYTARGFLGASAEDGTRPVTVATAGLTFVSFGRGWRWGRNVFMMPSTGPDKVLTAELRKASTALVAARQGKEAFARDSAAAYLCELEDVIGSQLAISDAVRPLGRLIVRRMASFPGGRWPSTEAFPLGGNDPELQAAAAQADVGTVASLVRDRLDGYDRENVMRELKSEFTSAAAFRVAHGAGAPRANGGSQTPPANIAPARGAAVKHRRGRKVDTDAKADKRIADAWETRSYKTYEECGTALGKPTKQVKDAIDRNRKRRKASE